MTHIALVILISSLIFVTFKLFNRYQIDNFQAITVNYVVASILGFIIAGSQFNYSSIIEKSWFVYAIIIGFIFIFTFLLFALSSQKAGVAITAVFSKMSVIIPVIAGTLLFSETLNLLKILGIVFTLAAFILIFYKKEKNKIQLSIIILPILIFFANGFIDTFLKYVEFNHIAGDYTLFLTTGFMTACIIGVIISAFKYFKTKKKFSKPTILGGVILGILNYTTTYFLFLAMSQFQSNVLFPITNIGIVMLSALFGLILFREKLSKTNWAGILLSILAILMIAFA